MQQNDSKYTSLLDSLTTYSFLSLQELSTLPKTVKPKPVRIIGKFTEAKDGISTLSMDGANVQCNFKQMRHKFAMNSTAHFECLGEIADGILYPHIVINVSGVNVGMYKTVSQLMYCYRLRNMRAY